jgi:hypothetical protein
MSRSGFGTLAESMSNLFTTKKGKVSPSQYESDVCNPGDFDKYYLKHISQVKKDVPYDIQTMLTYYETGDKMSLKNLLDDKLDSLDNIIDNNKYSVDSAFDLEDFLRELENPEKRNRLTSEEKTMIEMTSKKFNSKMNEILTDIINQYDDPIEIIIKSSIRLQKICATTLMSVLFNIRRKIQELQKLKIQSAGAKKRSAKTSAKKRIAIKSQQKKRSAKKSSKKRSAKKSSKKRSVKKSAKKSTKKRSAKKSAKKRSVKNSAKKSTKKRSVKKSAKKSTKKRSVKKSAKKSTKKRSAKRSISKKW